MNPALLALLLASAPAAEPVTASPAVVAAPAHDATHAAFTSLLQRFVRDGAVDYAGLSAAGPRAELQAYLAQLSSLEGMSGWSRAEQTAFWINAYNAWTLELMLRNPEVASIRDITWFWSSPWKIALAPFPGLGKGTLTLDDIEHGILRKELPDPRLHMALVCASKSCPPLRSEAYVASRLDAQLDDQARTFLGDPTKNQVDLAGGALKLSRIFEWYGGDFEVAGGVAAWVARYLPPEQAEAVRGGKLAVSYLPYDWSKNGR